MTDVVRAAGGIIHRPGRDDRLEVAIIHRPKYDDWSLPKGKLDGDETEEQAALREVEEETGLRCEIERVIGRVSYRDRHGRPKTVTYFAMHTVGGEFTPNDEADDLRWLSVADAIEALSYAHDKRLVAGIGDTPRL